MKRRDPTMRAEIDRLMHAVFGVQCNQYAMDSVSSQYRIKGKGMANTKRAAAGATRVMVDQFIVAPPDARHRMSHSTPH